MRTLTPWPNVARTPLVAGVGLFVGAGMLALSATGILGHIDRVSAGACLAAALLVSGYWVQRSRARAGIPGWALVLLLLLLALPTVAALAPPHEWDEVAYGAALPRDYALAGRFFYNADYGPYSAFPGNYEALATASLVLVGDVIPARVLNVLLALGLAVIAANLSRDLGASKTASLCAAALVLGAGTLLTSVPVVGNDVANAFFQSLALLSIAGYAATREPGRLALGAFFLGTAVGIKYSSLQFALCVAPLTVALILGGPGTRSDRLRDSALFAVVSAATAIPWYARNLATFGNPFFPFLNEVLRAHNGFSAEHSAITREMFEGLTGYSLRTSTLASLLSRTARGFGWVPLFLSVPGLVAAVARNRSRPAVFLAAVLLTFATATVLVGYWLPRYFLSLLVLCSVFAAVALEEFLRIGRALVGARLPVVALGLMAVAVGERALAEQWRTGGELVADVVHLDREQFVRTHVRYWALADWVNRNLAPGDRIAIGINIQPFYYLDRPYFHVHPMTEKGNLQALRTPKEYLRAFHALGLTWLAFSPYPDDGTYPEATAPRMNAFFGRFYRAREVLVQRGKLTLVAVVEGVSVYRIKPAAPGARLRED